LDVSQRRWPEEGLARVPYWVYTDADLYAKEQERIFGGAHWNYVALACEVPEPGDFKRSFVGDKPVVVTRDATGVLRVFENRCAHRGVQFCREHLGNTKRFTCPYHQWSYDLDGSLVGVPFRRGVKGQGGMPEGFDRGEHALRTLAVAERNGVVFASFDDSVEPLDAYLGESMLGYFERVFDGRPLRVLGYQKQKIPANWKLMFENIKDPYHASLLHVFLVSFGLFRADQPSAVKMDATGRHAVLVSRKGEQKASEATEDIRNLRTDFVLNDPRLLDPVREFPGDATVVMQTLWPFFGYAEDTEEMTTRRLRQANLMGVSGFVSADDSEVMKFSQEGLDPYADQAGVMEMGGTDVVDEEHMVTEAAIRAFYAHYRRVMDLG
jgi:salicylate 5-hydroxylase large subunit